MYSLRAGRQQKQKMQFCENDADKADVFFGTKIVSTVSNDGIFKFSVEAIDKAELKAGQPIPEVQRKTYGSTCHRRPFADVIESDVNPDLVICLTDCQT